MDKTVAGLLGAVAALGAASTAQAAVPLSVEPVSEAQSYADLLKPIPNAAALLAAADEAERQADLDRAGADSAPLFQVQYYRHHHHHHHHHRFIPRIIRRQIFRHHHHHHHHHHNFNY